MPQVVPKVVPKVVLVDMDNTIADFDGRALEILKERHPEITVSRTDLTKFPFAANFPNEMKPEINALFQEQGFFRSFVPIAGAIDALKEIQAEEGIEVFLCTAPIARSCYCQQEKVEWVRAHLDGSDGSASAKRQRTTDQGRTWVQRLVITSDKSLVRGDLLIDDAPVAKAENLEPSWEHVWLTQPYNVSLSGKRRIDGWQEWRKVVLENRPAPSVPPAEQQQQHHPSALRNRVPILKQLLSLLPAQPTGAALEIATGTGAHLETYAPAFPSLTFHPSEFVPEVAATPEKQWATHGKIGLRPGLDELANIDAHGCKVFSNVLPAVALDLSVPYDAWPTSVRGAAGTFSLVVCSNTLHITPWSCSLGLLHGAAAVLAAGGHLVIYGPFKVNGAYVGSDGGAGNAKFDAKLRATNSSWGFRDVDELVRVAGPLGLTLCRKADMPANNLTLAFVKNAA